MTFAKQVKRELGVLACKEGVLAGVVVIVASLSKRR